jgi:hypothetical protein
MPACDEPLIQQAVLRVANSVATSTKQLYSATSASAVCLLPRDSSVSPRTMDFSKFRFYFLSFAGAGVRESELRVLLVRHGVLFDDSANLLFFRPDTLIVAYGRRVFQLQQQALAFQRERERWEQERAQMQRERDVERSQSRLTLENAQMLVLGCETMFMTMKHQALMLSSLSPSPPPPPPPLAVFQQQQLPLSGTVNHLSSDGM